MTIYLTPWGVPPELPLSEPVVRYHGMLFIPKKVTWFRHFVETPDMDAWLLNCKTVPEPPPVVCITRIRRKRTWCDCGQHVVVIGEKELVE